MKRLVILAFFCSQLISCHQTAHTDNDSGWVKEPVSNTITVMSYNIKYGSPLGSSVPDLRSIADVIKKNKPDVVFLQEVDKNTTRSGNVDQLALLAAETDMSFYYFGKAIDYQGGEFGLGILSHYPLSDSKTFKLPKIELGNQYVSDRILVTASISIDKTDIIIANTHLALTQANRDIQVPRIKEILSTWDEPIIFAGDLNSKPESSTIQSFIDYGFKKTCITHCYTIPSNDPYKELDYILLKPLEKFQVLSHLVIDNQSSDHLPIMSVLKIK